MEQAAKKLGVIVFLVFINCPAPVAFAGNNNPQVISNPDVNTAEELLKNASDSRSKLKALKETNDMARAASEGMAKIFFWSAIGILGIGLGLFILKLFYNIFIGPMRQRAAYKRYVDGRTSPMEKLLAQAEQLATSDKTLTDAIRLFERAGDLARAAQCKIRLNDPLGAAALFERSGHLDKAANLYESAGDYLQAAKVLRKAGAYRQAAEHFKTADKIDMAAECLEEGGFTIEAARIYEGIGQIQRAAMLYEEAGDSAKAGELVAALASKGAETSPQLADKAAKLMEKAGQKEQAAEFYALAGEVIRAVEIFVLSNQVKRAAGLYSSCSADLADELVTRIRFDSLEAPKFAQMLLMARDYKTAARVFEGLGKYHEAAELYTRCGDHYRAGEMYTLMGDRKSAAEAMERAGDFQTAAELYDVENNIDRAARCFKAACRWFDAGKRFFQLDQGQEALTLLQKVEPTDQNYFEASVMVAKLMLDNGLNGGAKRRLDEITSGRQCTRSSIEAFYLLAISSLSLGDEETARKALSSVVDKDVRYENASELLTTLQKKGIEAASGLTGIEPKGSGELGFLSPPIEQVSRRESMVVNVREDLDSLHKLPLFLDLGLEEIRALRGIIMEKYFEKGTIVLEFGGTGPGLFIIKSGTVAVERKDQGQEMKLTTLQQGEHFGEISLLAEIPVTARVKAESDVSVLYMPRQDLLKLLENNQNLALKLYKALTKALSSRLRDTSDLVFKKLAVE